MGYKVSILFGTIQYLAVHVDQCHARLDLMGWATSDGAAHVLYYGYRGVISPTVTKKKDNRRRKNKVRQPQEESVNMINTLRSEYDHLLASPFLAKKYDPGVPTIECTIGQRIFHKTFCDIGLGVNKISKATYEYLFGDKSFSLHICNYRWWTNQSDSRRE